MGAANLARDDGVVENTRISSVRQIGEFTGFFGGFGGDVQGLGYLVVAHPQKA